MRVEPENSSNISGLIILSFLDMHQSTPSPRTGAFKHIGMAAIVLAICIPAQASDTRRCQINGKTVITNLSCEQLANEAGIPYPASTQPVTPPKLTHTAPEKINKTQALAADKTATSVSAAMQRSVDNLVSTVLTLGLSMLFVIGLLVWLKHKARQAVQTRLTTLGPLARDTLEPILDKAFVGEDEELPYRQAPVMSRYELEMFERIKTALPECEIFPQAPLASFIRIDPQRAGKRLATKRFHWQNRISQQRVDFLVCLRRDMSTVAAIELDDPSHESDEAQRRDAKKDKSLNDANVPLIRWRVEAMPEAEEIRREFVQRGLLVG